MVIEHCHLENSLASRIESDQVGSSRQFVLAQSNFGPGQLWVGRHRDDEASEALDPQNRAEPKTKKQKKNEKTNNIEQHRTTMSKVLSRVWI